ncbi:hypothetical protein [Corallococcus macrosporus]|uniref:hypothetical protein n=1 Tax=Corallococcus macrosporus TaxID=35 RepID=UPI0012FE4A86|nr:hypothetical protein [Corallococcus macrosporus]
MLTRDLLAGERRQVRAIPGARFRGEEEMGSPLGPNLFVLRCRVRDHQPQVPPGSVHQPGESDDQDEMNGRISRNGESRIENDRIVGRERLENQRQPVFDETRIIHNPRSVPSSILK